MSDVHKCDACNYSSDILLNYNRHLKSKSHKLVMANIDGQKPIPHKPDFRKNEPILDTGNSNDLIKHCETCKQEAKYKIIEEECTRLKHELATMQKELYDKNRQLAAEKMNSDIIDEERRILLNKFLEYLDNGKFNPTVTYNISNEIELNINYIKPNPFIEIEKQIPTNDKSL